MLERVRHKTRGVCQLWADLGTHLDLIDSRGTHFQAHPLELEREGQDSLISSLEMCLTASLTLEQVDINDPNLYPDELSRKLNIDEDLARMIIFNRPDVGYLDYPNLIAVMASWGYQLPNEVIQNFKSKSLILFGGTEHL